MSNRKRWSIILLVAILVAVLMPIETWHQTIWVSADKTLQVTLNNTGYIEVESYGCPIPYSFNQKFVRYDHYSYDAMLWNFSYKRGPDGITRWRFVSPACCQDKWWNLAMYFPSFWIDYGLFEADELVIFIKPVPHSRFDLTHGYVWGHTFGWSNQTGWYCNYCEE